MLVSAATPSCVFVTMQLAGTFVFGNKFCLRIQPVLHIVPGLRPLVQIREVGFCRCLFRCRHKINLYLCQGGNFCQLCRDRPVLPYVRLRILFTFHLARMVRSMACPLWGITPTFHPVRAQ